MYQLTTKETVFGAWSYFDYNGALQSAEHEPALIKPPDHTCQIALKNAHQAETGRCLSDLNYLNEQWQKCNVAIETSLELLQINKRLLTPKSTISSERKSLIKNTYKCFNQ